MSDLFTDRDLSILGRLLFEGRLIRDESQKPFAKELIAEFLKQIHSENPPTIRNIRAFILKKIQEIDETISNQLNHIIHHPFFQDLEGSWRGLHYFVSKTKTSSRLNIRLLNVKRTELQDDLEKAVDFDQSEFFKKVYEEEYGTFGGNPYSCLIGDFYFSRHPKDLEFIEKIGAVASAAHTPFIASAAPALFDLDSFEDLSIPRELAKVFESQELIKWSLFRQTEDSRYVVLCLPSILMRLPYGEKTNPIEGLNFEEDVARAHSARFCWGNAAYALGQRITNAFDLFGWTAAIRGVEGGGTVEDLPAYTFKTLEGDIALKCPTETAITDRREKELSDLGFMALCHCKGTGLAAFFGGQTLQKPKTYTNDEANANATLSSRLPYVLAASRFAHYIKVIMRDKIGSFTTREEIEVFLNNWIAAYILLNDEAPQHVKAAYPLREARIEVFDVHGKPGIYRAVIYLRPHFQMEELTASIRLVATLPPPAQ